MRAVRPRLGSWVRLALSALLVAGASLACAPESAPRPEVAAGPVAEAPGGGAEPARAAAPATGPDLHLGVDVSSYSGEIDWIELKGAGHTFAFLKATEGMDLKDPAFDANWPKVQAAGMIRGAYHFYVTEDDPRKQAEFFIKTVQLGSGDLAPVVDIESLGHNTQPGLAGRLKTFVTLLQDHYGVKPIIYTGAAFWDEHLAGEAASDGFGDHPLWVAEYEVEAPRLPQGWSDWHLWQWQGDAQVPGVAQGADLSKVNHASGIDIADLLIP